MTFLLLLRREFRALASLPHTYSIGAAFLTISGVFFANILISTQSPDLGRYYSNIASTLIVLLPIVAMRSFAEERRSGVLDLTLSWPVPRLTLVLTRFMANTLLAWLLCSIAWVYIRIISGLAPLDMARAAGGYVGLLFLSMAFSALALMVSARAGTPTAAAFLGFGLLLFLWILDFAPGWIGDVVGEYGPSKHFESFALSPVHKNVKLAEAFAARQPIIQYDPAASGAMDYLRVAKELLNGEETQVRRRVEGRSDRR
jgi:ABC-type transport system involved in multi-copper enzyme maturation permease subunit